MTPPPRDQLDSLLVDVTGLNLSELLHLSDSPIMASLQRIDAGIDDEATAGFADGIT